MPRVSEGMIPPGQVQEFSGLTRSSLRRLHEAGILPALSRLTAADAVVARFCRYLYWRGPEASAPSHSPERERVREVAARVSEHVRGILGGDVPLMVAVDPSDGRVISIGSMGALVDFPSDGRVWMYFSLQAWWEEVRGVGGGGSPGRNHGSTQAGESQAPAYLGGYSYRVKWSAEEQAYLASTAEFPSLTFVADSPAGAVRGVYELVRDVLADLGHGRSLGGIQPPPEAEDGDGAD